MLIVLGFFSFYNVSRKGGAGMDGDCDERLLLDSSSFMDEDVYTCQCFPGLF